MNERGMAHRRRAGRWCLIVVRHSIVDPGVVHAVSYSKVAGPRGPILSLPFDGPDGPRIEPFFDLGMTIAEGKTTGPVVHAAGHVSPDISRGRETGIELKNRVVDAVRMLVQDYPHHRRAGLKQVARFGCALDGIIPAQWILSTLRGRVQAHSSRRRVH